MKTANDMTRKELVAHIRAVSKLWGVVAPNITKEVSIETLRASVRGVFCLEYSEQY